ncbi:hypothetical protein D3C72_1922060 [compost metagenome]
MQPQYLVLSPRIARHDLAVAVEHDPVAVITHRRNRKQLADQRRHTLDIGNEHRIARFEVALGTIGQRRLDQLGTVHVARHQQNAGLVVEAVGLIMLVKQGPRR